MRLGFLTSDLQHGHGWGHYSLSLIRALRAEGAEMTVVAAHNTPDDSDFPVLPLLPAVSPRDRFFLPRLSFAAGRVRDALKDCDVIHSHIEPYAPLAVWLAGERPLFITGHGSYVRLPQTRRWPVGTIYRRSFAAGTMVCVSHYTESVARALMPGLRTVVVNNGVDIERFAHLPPLDTPQRGPTVLAVGGVKARKGTLELVRAMAVIRRTLPEAQCVILGGQTAEPAYTEQVQAEIAALGLTDCVHLPGHVPEHTLKAWYGAADVFALPSMNDGWKFEGYGLVHLEASAAGLPVIGTTGCGAEDAVEDGVTGLLIPQDTIATALPKALLRLLHDPALARRMGAAGRERAARQTWTHVARRMLVVYGDSA
ncbi:MAG: glycosyltransferase family 4 protein [Anaerolineaceae bacterium]|nr:glycosyltransferase family 4 protein [Anaerolineaceae bacterium]